MTEKQEDFIIYEGQKYWRVSSILNKYNNLEHIDPSILQNKQDIGTRVHKAIEMEASGLFPMVTAQDHAYFLSYLAWISQVKPVLIQSEERYFDKDLMITGQIDAIYNIGGETVIVDFKTSVKESPTWEMQAHFYHYLVKKHIKGLSDRVVFLKLDKMGKNPTAFSYTFSQRTMGKCLIATTDFFIEKKEKNSQ